MATDIYFRIPKVHNNYDRNKKYLIDIYGCKDMEDIYPNVSSTVMNGSFFGWQLCSPVRIIAYMKILGFSNLDALDPNTRLKLKSHYEGMTIWPDEGCIKVVEGITLIKLGNTPGYYYEIKPEN